MTDKTGQDNGPVDDGLVDDIRERHDEPPLVPDVDHHVGRGDLADRAPLPFDDHHVADLDGLGEGDLDTGDEVADERPGGHAEDEPLRERPGDAEV